MAISTQDKTKELQRTLYRTAKADPQRRFHALYDKVHRRDVLERAWQEVRRNRGASGIDQQTIEDVELYGVDRLLGELEADLRTQSYRPLPARRVFIPKPGTCERRPLSIPAVRDRIVQAAAKTVIEPIFEADFLPCSFGFRPKRSAHDALQAVLDNVGYGPGRWRWIVETDIASCFEEIPHDKLVFTVEERICDRKLLKLLRAFLRAGVMEEGAVARSVSGTPQGGVISPLLANIYLHRLDREWTRQSYGGLTRYADDLVVVCKTERQAHAALGRLRAILSNLGLRTKDRKTRIVELREGGEGFDFLGFHHRWIRHRSAKYSHLTFLARWPSRQAMARVRARLRSLTVRSQTQVPVDQKVREINAVLRGWAQYFRHGSSHLAFNEIEGFTINRLALFVAKRHQKRGAGWGWHAIVYRSHDRMGLMSLEGLVRQPRPQSLGRG